MERALAKEGANKPVDECVPLMQRVYDTDWSETFCWNGDSSTTLSHDTRPLDQGLVNGVKLARAGRSTVFDFHKAHGPGGGYAIVYVDQLPVVVMPQLACYLALETLSLSNW